jgi:thioredoxin 1
MVVKIVTSHAEFKTLTSGSTPVIVDFFATWCGPCKMISPKFEAFSEVYNNVIFIQIDVDDVSDVAEACEVRAMPTFQVYKDGKMIDEIVGADPVKLESAIKKL